MKILKRGLPPEERSIKASCNNCKTVVSFKPLEAQYVPDQRDGDYLRIGCPVCNRFITVAAK